METDTVSAVADVITASAAVVALVVAGMWRRTRRAGEQAEVARRALAAFLKFADGLAELATLPPGLCPAEPLTAMVERRWLEFRALERDFEQAWALVEQELDDQTEVLFHYTWLPRELVFSAQSAYSLLVTYRAELHSLGARDEHLFVKGFGDHRRQEIAHLRKLSKRLLKPLINYRAAPRLR